MFKRVVLFLLVFSLPFQLGYHFWLPETYVASFRIDYLAPTFYLTDLLLILFLATNFKITVSIIINFFIKPSGWFFGALVLLNLATASFSLITILAWVRLGSYLLLLAALAKTDHLAKKVLLPFSLSLIFIIGLAITQFILQSSLGGILYFFGERPLSLALPNVAKMNLPWGQILRPYATFSHPNSLAGYLLVSLVILRQIPAPKVIRHFLIGAIVLTFSKAAIFTLIILELIRPKLIQIILLSAVLGFLPFLRLDPSFSSRYYLLPPTAKIVGDRPFFGVGLKQFIPSLATHLPASQVSYATLQPVHHTFILIFAELGLLGVLLITKIFWTPLSKLTKDKKIRPYLLDLFSIILMPGSLDHYWWTLPQNQLIIVLVLALIANMSNKSHKSNKSYEI